MQTTRREAGRAVAHEMIARTLTRPAGSVATDTPKARRRHEAAELYEALKLWMRDEGAMRASLPKGVRLYVDEDDLPNLNSGDVTMRVSAGFAVETANVEFAMRDSLIGVGACDGTLSASRSAPGILAARVQARCGNSTMLGDEMEIETAGDEGAALWRVLLDEVFMRYCAEQARFGEASEGGPARHGATPAPEAPEAPAGTGMRLYDVDEVERAMRETEVVDPSQLTEAERRRRTILAKGRDAASRRLVHADDAMLAKLAGLEAQAPHLREFTSALRRQMALSMRTGTPLRMKPTLLVGAPGTSKSYAMRRIGEILGLPFRKISMNSTTLADSFSGSHPIFRNGSQGIVAATLLKEEVANPIMLVDEFDKPGADANGDPMRPFYTLLEPESALAFVDDFLGFPMDASHMLWVMTANSVAPIPAAILSRFKVFEVPAITPEQMRAIVTNVHLEENGRNNGWFDPELQEDVMGELCSMTPRRARIALGEGMAAAAFDQRRWISADDLPKERDGGRRMGFMAG